MSLTKIATLLGTGPYAVVAPDGVHVYTCQPDGSLTANVSVTDYLANPATHTWESFDWPGGLFISNAPTPDGGRTGTTRYLFSLAVLT